jgi:cystathionine beta-lyase
MTYNFDIVHNRRSSESVKWRYYDEDILPLWVADMDFHSPQTVIDALLNRVQHGIFGYPVLLDGIKESVISWLDRRHDWIIEPEDIVFLPGVVTGFNLAAQAFAEPGDGVFFQTPAYGPFFRVAGNANLLQQEMELTLSTDGKYIVDYDRFQQQITDRTKVFILCNPQNPTGRVFRDDELERMAEICLKNNLIICSDEIHCDIIYSGKKHIPIAALDPEIANNTITLIAPSKTFNIAGLKTSVAIIQNPELREKYLRAKRGLVSSINLLGLSATLAAYQHGESWLNELTTYLEGNRNYLVDFIKKEIPEIKISTPEGTYLAWLDCRDANFDDKPYQYFLNHARVALNDGEWFGNGGEGFVRLNFGCPRVTLIEALNRIKSSLG